MKPESNRIEYKRHLNDKFERSVVAFPNYPGGGEILVGVNDDGTIAGVRGVDGVQLKPEISSNRITVTSAGGLANGLSRKDFFNCLSMPRNRILMRVFRDVELVESLGSGMTRILQACGRSIFEPPQFSCGHLSVEAGEGWHCK